MYKSFFVLTLLVGISLSLALCVCITAATAQTESSDTSEATEPTEPSFHLSAGTTFPAELEKALDAGKLKAGDTFELRTTARLLSGGRVVLPERSKIKCHVTDVKVRSKREPNSKLGISFDTVVLPDGRDVVFHAALQAIAKPLLSDFSVPMPGGGGGRLTQPDDTAIGTTVRLESKDEGVVGMPWLTLESFVHGGAIKAGSGNVHLDRGAQFLLRITKE